MELEKFRTDIQRSAKHLKETFKRLKKANKKDLDPAFHQAHEQVFESIDCLSCANCCKTTSPIFTQNDIQRVAAKIKITPSEFLKRYLHMDEDGDFVLNSAPCPFLDHDNFCSVYDSRPTACREYPHTNRKRMYQILDLTEKNAEICPAVFRIVQKLNQF